jgi:hypothetical protein
MIVGRRCRCALAGTPGAEAFGKIGRDGVGWSVHTG